MNKDKAWSVLRKYISGTPVKRSELDKAEAFAASQPETDPLRTFAIGKDNKLRKLNELRKDQATADYNNRLSSNVDKAESISQALSGAMGRNLGNEQLNRYRSLTDEAGDVNYMNTRGVDPRLQVGINDATGRASNIGATASGQAVLEGADRGYSNAVRNAQMASGGQASVFGSMGQQAASDSSRARLDASRELDRLRSQELSRADRLMGYQRDEQSRIDDVNRYNTGVGNRERERLLSEAQGLRQAGDQNRISGYQDMLYGTASMLPKHLTKYRYNPIEPTVVEDINIGPDGGYDAGTIRHDYGTPSNPGERINYEYNNYKTRGLA